jgi:hypothetical protein
VLHQYRVLACARESTGSAARLSGGRVLLPARRATSLLVRPMKPNSVPATRSNGARVEVARLLDTGGEPPPVLRIADRVSA